METGAAGRREGTERETFANDDDEGDEEDGEDTETNKKKGGHEDEDDEEEEEEEEEERDLQSPCCRGKKTRVANKPHDTANERGTKRHEKIEQELAIAKSSSKLRREAEPKWQLDGLAQESFQFSFFLRRVF